MTTILLTATGIVLSAACVLTVLLYTPDTERAQAFMKQHAEASQAPNMEQLNRLMQQP